MRLLKNYLNAFLRRQKNAGFNQNHTSTSLNIIHFDSFDCSFPSLLKLILIRVSKMLFTQSLVVIPNNILLVF